VTDEPSPEATSKPAGGKPKRQSFRQRYEPLVAKYGYLAIGIHLTIGFAVWAVLAVAIAAGFSVNGSDGAVGWGAVGAAWVAMKLSSPVRIAITVVITPGVAWFLDRLRGRHKRVPAVDE